jgi:hypothetical protein
MPWKHRRSGGVAPPFLISAPGEGERSASSPCASPTGKELLSLSLCWKSGNRNWNDGVGLDGLKNTAKIDVMSATRDKHGSAYFRIWTQQFYCKNPFLRRTLSASLFSTSWHLIRVQIARMRCPRIIVLQDALFHQRVPCFTGHDGSGIT